MRAHRVAGSCLLFLLCACAEGTTDPGAPEAVLQPARPQAALPTRQVLLDLYESLSARLDTLALSGAAAEADHLFAEVVLAGELLNLHASGELQGKIVRDRQGPWVQLGATGEPIAYRHLLVTGEGTWSVLVSPDRFPRFFELWLRLRAPRG